MIEIVVTPSNGGHFNATVDGEKLCSSRTPFFSAARVLLKRGVDPDTKIVMRHTGSETTSLRSTVGAAAALTVDESGPKFAKLQGLPPWGVGVP
jgi:hypothetical protein